MGQIYERLYGEGAAVNTIVASPADVARYKDSHAHIVKPALREVVYETS